MTAVGTIKYYGKNCAPNPHNYHFAVVYGINGAIHVQERGERATKAKSQEIATTHIELNANRRKDIKRLQRLLDNGKISLEDAFQQLGIEYN